MASAPYLGGGFGHFYAYAPAKFEYPINRFAMETKRQLDLLDQRLSKKRVYSWLRIYDRRYGDLVAVWPISVRKTLQCS